MQSEFNDCLADCINQASEEVVCRSADKSTLVKAKQALDEGLRLIATRQELIKIAEFFKYGWGVVAVRGR